jgi:hypothetical protein
MTAPTPAFVWRIKWVRSLAVALPMKLQGAGMVG